MRQPRCSYLLLRVLLCLSLPGLVLAQGLTEQQYQSLNTDITITHQAEFATAVAASDFATIAAAYNLQAAPVFWVWRTSLPEKEIYEAITTEGTSWNWTTFIGQSVQERDAWNTQMHPGVINPSLPQTRAMFTKIFSGSGQVQVDQRTHLLTVSRRQALRGEALLANTTGGAGTTAAPASLTYEGKITYIDVNHCISGAPLP
jgi:hypothetical protein